MPPASRLRTSPTMRPDLETAPSRDPGTARSASRAPPGPLRRPSPLRALRPGRHPSGPAPLPSRRSLCTAGQGRTQCRASRPFSARVAAKLPAWGSPCPPSPPRSLPGMLPEGHKDWTTLFRSEDRLAASGCACCACTAPGCPLPFPSLRLSCALSRARGAQCFPFDTSSLASIPRGMGLCACATGRHACRWLPRRTGMRAAVRSACRRASAGQGCRPGAVHGACRSCHTARRGQPDCSGLSSHRLVAQCFCRAIFGLDAPKSKNIIM